MRYIKDMHSVLIIEDDNSFSHQLATILTHSNFDSHIEDTCEGGVAYFMKNEQDIDLILLDVNFDNKPCGLDVLKQIRSMSDVWIGVMSYNHNYVDQASLLGSRMSIKKDIHSIEELINHLEYSSKFGPFNRSREESECNFEYVEEEGCFKLNSERLSLGPLQYQILYNLYTKPSIERESGSPTHIYSQGDINKLTKRDVYDKDKNRIDTHDTTNVRVNIKHIRDKMNAISNGCGMKIIKTDPGFGYSCTSSPPQT